MSGDDFDAMKREMEELQRMESQMAAEEERIKKRK